ncbi:fermentation-respiration switch protein FrsA (DUF1100 family) [Sinorhizobium fredii]
MDVVVSTAKLLLVLLTVATIAYMSLLGVTYISQRALLYPGARQAPGHASWGETVYIRTPDGETLFGLYSRGKPRKPAVLFFLGNADRIDNYSFLAQALASRGIGLLAISYRGYPGSTGTPSEVGLLTDGVAAFDWLAAGSEGPIIVLGQSLGSGVAIDTARRRPAIAVILVSGYLSVLSLAQTIYPYFPVALLIKDPFRSDLRIAEVRQPKLFIHGRRDAVIPLSSGEALYEIAPKPKQMLIYDGFGHNDLWDAPMIDDIIRFVETL